MRDYLGILSAAQVLSGGHSYDTGLYSDFSYDLKAAGADPGNTANPLYFVFMLTTTLAEGTGDAYLNCYLVDDDNGPLASATTLSLLHTFAPRQARYVDAARAVCKIPAGIITQQYIGAFFQSTARALTGGAINCWITDQATMHRKYAKSFDPYA
jgi:hypothetical protein